MRSLDGARVALFICTAVSTEFTMPQLKFSLAEIKDSFAKDDRTMLYEINIDSNRKVANAGLILANFRDYLDRLELDCCEIGRDAGKIKENVDLAAQVIKEFEQFETEGDIVVDEIETCRASIANYKLKMSPDNYIENKNLAAEINCLKNKVLKAKQKLSELQSSQKLLMHQVAEKQSLKKLRMGTHVPDLESKVSSQGLEIQRLEKEAQKEGRALEVASKNCVHARQLLDAAGEANEKLKCEIQSLKALAHAKLDKETMSPENNKASKLLSPDMSLARGIKAVEDDLRRSIEHRASALAERKAKLGHVEERIRTLLSRNDKLSCKSTQLGKESKNAGNVSEQLDDEERSIRYEAMLRIHKYCSGIIERLEKIRRIEGGILKIRCAIKAREYPLMLLAVVLSIVFYAVCKLCC